jgi:biopolymer transport protein ExbB/TolQ
MTWILLIFALVGLTVALRWLWAWRNRRAKRSQLRALLEIEQKRREYEAWLGSLSDTERSTHAALRAADANGRPESPSRRR